MRGNCTVEEQLTARIETKVFGKSDLVTVEIVPVEGMKGSAFEITCRVHRELFAITYHKYFFYPGLACELGVIEQEAVFAVNGDECSRTYEFDNFFEFLLARMT